MKKYRVLVDGKEWEIADSYSEACEMTEYKSQWHDNIDIESFEE